MDFLNQSRVLRSPVGFFCGGSKIRCRLVLVKLLSKNSISGKKILWCTQDCALSRNYSRPQALEHSCWIVLYPGAPTTAPIEEYIVYPQVGSHPLC
jgi:hypothetical protein